MSGSCPPLDSSPPCVLLLSSGRAGQPVSSSCPPLVLLSFIFSSSVVLMSPCCRALYPALQGREQQCLPTNLFGVYAGILPKERGGPTFRQLHELGATNGLPFARPPEVEYRHSEDRCEILARPTVSRLRWATPPAMGRKRRDLGVKWIEGRRRRFSYKCPKDLSIFNPLKHDPLSLRGRGFVHILSTSG